MLKQNLDGIKKILSVRKCLVQPIYLLITSETAKELYIYYRVLS